MSLVTIIINSHQQQLLQQRWLRHKVHQQILFGSAATTWYPRLVLAIDEKTLVLLCHVDDYHRSAQSRQAATRAFQT